MSQLQRAAGAALRSAAFQLAQHQEAFLNSCKPYASHAAIDSLHATYSTGQDRSANHSLTRFSASAPGLSLLSLGGTCLLSHQQQQQLRCMSSSGASSGSSSNSAASSSGSSSTSSKGSGGGSDVGGAAGMGAANASGLLSGFKLQVPSNPFAPRKPRPAVAKLVLYRGKGMLFFRFVVRAKVFQLMGFLAAAVFASAVLTTNNPDPMDLAAVGALAVGCVVTSYCIWYYSGRYVGEMSLLLPERRVVRFSVLDFWGNREDNDVPLEAVVPPWRQRSVAEVRSQARQALMPLAVAGGDREYYISVPHGHVLQKELLQKLLYGVPLDEAAAAASSTGDGAASSSSSGQSGSGSSSNGGAKSDAPAVPMMGTQAEGQGARAPAGVAAAAGGAATVSDDGKDGSAAPAAASEGRAAK